MIVSMTAFGRAQIEASGYSVTVEVKALNGRFLDIAVRLPKNCLDMEDPLRKRIAQMVKRGRIEAHFQVETTAPHRRAPRLNIHLARLYWEQLQELHRHLPGTEKPTLENVLSIPYIFETPEVVEDRDAMLNLLGRALEGALEELRRSRSLEGEALCTDLLTRLRLLEEGVSHIDRRKESVAEEYALRLRDRMQELLKDTPIDESRILQEVACLAERSDINEELVRLRSHLNQLKTMLSGAGQADGRKLDFFIQELHREINTIGSKTNDLETVQVVVQMKSEIGKLKEQVQNIE
ncbi:MAG: YicC family protein [Deltaproteobacteria bacterium]|nr:YicC family protein [Deltaproteobacteria bacterium]